MTPVTDPGLLAQLNGPTLRGVREPRTLGLLEYDVDFDAKPAEVRARIARLPETEKKRAHDLWAEHRVAKTPGLSVPQPARGIPVIGPYLDEAVGGVQSVLHDLSGGRIGAPYDEAVAEERARHRSADARYPVQSAVGKLAAGVATGAPLFAGLAPAATLVGRVAQGAAVGGGVGAAEGFGAGEGTLNDRLASAQSTAVEGGMIGGVIPVGGAIVTRGYGAIADRVAPTITRLRHGPEAAADRILAQRIVQEGSSPAAKRLDLQTGQAVDARMGANSTAHLPETIADTSDAMRRLTGSVYRQGGEAGNFVRDTLGARQRGAENIYARTAGGAPDGQMARVMDATERALLIRSAGTAYQTEQQIMRQQAAEGRRLYDLARQQQEPFDLQPAIDGLSLTAMQYPGPFRRQLQRALSLFRDDGPNRFQVGTIERFDASKKALDDMIETAQRQGQGNLTRELTIFKHSLIEAVHAPNAAGQPTRNLAYQEARNAWGSAAENRAAIDLGRGALREGSEVGVEQFAALPAGQQRLFRLGFLESVREALRTRRPGNDVTQLFEQQRVRDLMREVVPTPAGRNAVFADRPERFGNLLRREARMVQTNNAVLGNSATAQRQADDMQFAGDALASMWNRFRQAPSLFNVAMEAVGTGIQRAFSYRQDVALALARRLLEADPATRNQILRRLQGLGAPDAFARFADAVDRSSTALTAAAVGPTQRQEHR